MNDADDYLVLDQEPDQALAACAWAMDAARFRDLDVDTAPGQARGRLWGFWPQGELTVTVTARDGESSHVLVHAHTRSIFLAIIAGPREAQELIRRFRRALAEQDPAEARPRPSRRGGLLIPRPPHPWQGYPGRVSGPLSWLTRPCVMGILNVTPDSFSDGGVYLDPSAAQARLREMAAEGAAICDVGAESTRPGAAPVPEAEQLRRLGPLLAAVGAEGAPAPLSIDTSSVRVAEAALDAGAVLVNDVTAGRAEPRMAPLVAERGAAICLMHMRGDPRTMQADPTYQDVVGEVRDWLAARLDAVVAAGVPEERILLDPGIGFGKTLAHNLALLAGLPALVALGRPVVVGVSRKGMFEGLLGRPPGERMAGSLAAGLVAVASGAAVIRAHDVAETVDALRVWVALAAAPA